MKFSIITCTYNSEIYIKKNIGSVKNQTYKNYEHIFIDAFSTDSTVEIIKRYQQEFPDKVKLFQFKPNGISNAMNRGIEKSQGEYLIHLHSDDSFYDNKILTNTNNFINNNSFPDLIYGKAKFINTETGNYKIIPHRRIYQRIRFWLLLLTNYIPHQAVFLKRSAFEKYGMFDEQYKNSMDYEMWLRLSKNKIDSEFFNLIICNFSLQPNSQSTIGKENCLTENRKIKEKYLRNKQLLKILNWIEMINSKREMIR